MHDSVTFSLCWLLFIWIKLCCECDYAILKLLWAAQVFYFFNFFNHITSLVCSINSYREIMGPDTSSSFNSSKEMILFINPFLPPKPGNLLLCYTLWSGLPHPEFFKWQWWRWRGWKYLFCLWINTFLFLVYLLHSHRILLPI